MPAAEAVLSLTLRFTEACFRCRCRPVSPRVPRRDVGMPLDISEAPAIGLASPSPARCAPPPPRPGCASVNCSTQEDLGAIKSTSCRESLLMNYLGLRGLRIGSTRGSHHQLCVHHFMNDDWIDCYVLVECSGRGIVVQRLDVSSEPSITYRPSTP